MITIGIDPHKSTHMAVAIDDKHQPLSQLELTCDERTLINLRRGAKAWPERIWAIEGSEGSVGCLPASSSLSARPSSRSRPRSPHEPARYAPATAARPTASTR